MYGAILGDMIGSPYEFDRSPKMKEFPLFSRGTEYTDDSVMTIAVAEALLDTIGKADDEIKAALVSSMVSGAIGIPVLGMVIASAAGWQQRLQSHTAVMGMARPCGCLPLVGCMPRWMRRDGSLD